MTFNSVPSFLYGTNAMIKAFGKGLIFSQMIFSKWASRKDLVGKYSIRYFLEKQYEEFLKCCKGNTIVNLI